MTPAGTPALARIATALVTMAIAWLGGCGAGQRSDPAAAVRVVDAAVVRASPVALAVRVTLAIDGTDDREGLRVDRVAWTLAIAGSGPVRGTSVASDSDGGSAGAEPATFSFVARVDRGRAGDLAARLRYGAREYRLQGTAYVTGAAGAKALPFESSGALTARSRRPPRRR